MNNSFSVDNSKCMVDLHLHLDGAISIKSAKQLANMQNIQIPKTDEELLSIMQVSNDCKDLNEFLEKFAFPCSLMQTKEGICLATKNLLNELKEQGVMYAEIRLAPQLLTEKGLTQEEVVGSAIEGMQCDGIDSNLILCCMRGNNNYIQNVETINVAEKFLNKGVVAIDLAGAEAIFSTENFKNIFALATSKGIPFTIHAGEADGVNSIKKALEYGAVRIGHGVRAIEDEEFLNILAMKQIPLELCLTSNINTAIFKNINDWPLKKLMDSGIYITINTDDPAIEGTSIKKEYNKIIENFGIGKLDVKQFLINSVNASFATKELKRKLINKINQEFE